MQNNNTASVVIKLRDIVVTRYLTVNILRGTIVLHFLHSAICA